MIRKLISAAIERGLKRLGEEIEVMVEHPENEAYGDYATNVGLKLKARGSQVAAAIKAELEKDKELRQVVEKIEMVGKGFINFYLKEQVLLAELSEVLAKRGEYGRNRELAGKKLMVEFAHPNTHKQFHIGHLRNITIGEAVTRILEANGAEVIRANYQGDIGLHVAKAVWGIKERLRTVTWSSLEKKGIEERIKILGQAYAEAAEAYEADGKAKKEMETINLSLYEKTGKELMELWTKTRQWSLDYFGQIYQRLGTKYDRLYFESEVYEMGKKLTLQALKRGILERSQGAVVFKGEKYGLDTRVFLTKNGFTTYEGKELGLAALEFGEFGEIDRCIHVVAPEQTSFFKVTFKVEELMDPDKFRGKQYHLSYGYVDLKSGKMSSRKGLVVTGASVIEAAKEKVRKILQATQLTKAARLEVAEQVAVGAVKYSMLKYNTYNNIQFDIEESVALEGNSGPYLQYTYARAGSVVNRSSKFSDRPASRVRESLRSSVQSSKLQFKTKNLVINEEELRLLRWIYRYPEVVLAAGEQYEPNLVCQYLYELAQRFNTFYNKHRIIQEKEVGKRQLRLAITAAVARVLENGLHLLGIIAPRRM